MTENKQEPSSSSSSEAATTTAADSTNSSAANPFKDSAASSAAANEEDESSVASAALRNDFIRLTTQPANGGATAAEEEEDDVLYEEFDNILPQRQQQQQQRDIHNNNSRFSTSAAIARLQLGGAPLQPFQQQQQQQQQHYYSHLEQEATQSPPQPQQPTAPVYDYSQYNTNGYVMISSNSVGQSLAKAATTPPVLSLVLPVACIVTHILFIYGQVAPMWRLSLSAEHVEVWANSTSKTTDMAFDALGLNHKYHYQWEQERSVKTFTYGFAVQELWEAKGMPGVVLPRLAALLLVVFSGIWPHLKLLLLQWSWMKRTTNSTKRTRTLSWLAILGKWSLADVLTVCVMVGVLNLEWQIQPASIKEGIVNHLQTLLELAQQVWSPSDVCTFGLKFDAHDCGDGSLSVGQKLQCRICKDFVDEAYYRPDMVQKTGKKIVKDIAMGGGGVVRLSVVGMRGIYAFCAAVIFSVLLSVLVEWYNHLYLQTLRKSRRGDHTLSLTEESTTSPTPPSQYDIAAGGPTAAAAAAMISSSMSAVSNESDASEPLLLEEAPAMFEPMEIMDDQASVLDSMVMRTTSSRPYTCLQCHYIIPLVTLFFVVLADYLPSMERHVGGAIPNLLKDVLGIHFEKTYSLQTLQDTTGAAGGWDLLLMATFALFCVLGPLLRAFLVVLVAMTPPTDNTQRIRSLLVKLSNFLAAFCAWEVFLVAMVMVEMLMPTVTETILKSKACRIISELDDSGTTSCLQVSYERVPTTFACLVLGFVLVGGLAIHVSMEDQKIAKHGIERNNSNDDEDDDADVVSRSAYSAGPPSEINAPTASSLATDGAASLLTHEPSYITQESNISGDGGSASNVETMIQEELV